MKVGKVLWLTCVLAIIGVTSLMAGAASETSGDAPDAAELTLRAFGPFSPSGDAPEVQSWNDQILWQEIPDRLGINVIWEHVPTTDWEAQLGLVMASGDLPDIIQQVNPVLAAQYGIQGALVPLQNLIADHAPHFEQILAENPSVQGQITAPDGNIYFFPRVLEDPRTQFFAGWQIRRSWVEEVGMEIPTTLDEVYDVLSAIKELHPQRYPYVFDPRPFIWEFGVGSRGPNSPNDFFVEDSKIGYGPTDPRYREAVTYLNRLYSQGLIDPEYLTITSGWSDEGLGRITQEIGGFVFGSWAGFLTRFNMTLSRDGKLPDFVAMRPPGEGNLLTRHNTVDNGTGGVLTSTSSKNVAATRLYDYLYSEEGRLLVNFGLEGDTFEFVNGKPVNTDKVVNHPQLGILHYTNNYIANISLWPTVLMPESYVGTLTDPEALRGNAMAATEYADDIKVPVLQFTDAERERVRALERDINTFVDENLHSFIQGRKPLDEYDEFVNGLNAMGAAELLDLYTAAFARYKEAIGM